MPDEPIDQPITDPAPDAVVDPAPEPPVVMEPVGPVRTLTPEEDAIYGAELGALGYTFEPQGEGDEAVGFRVTGNGKTYDYRYREGESATELMDRIVVERGG